jgi:hypothetical protein
MARNDGEDPTICTGPILTKGIKAIAESLTASVQSIGTFVQ